MNLQDKLYVLYRKNGEVELIGAKLCIENHLGVLKTIIGSEYQNHYDKETEALTYQFEGMYNNVTFYLKELSLVAITTSRFKIS